jgi:thiol-disulfide isomerase/thioredoxin
MIRLRWIAASAFLATSLGAQQLPDGAVLMKQTQQAVKRFHSLQFANNMTMEMGPSMKMIMESNTAMVNPGKTRSETKVQGTTMLTVSDGETTWIYNSMAKQYVKRNAALGSAAIFAAMGMPNMPDFTKMKTTEKTIGEETIEIDGQKHDCWIVESRIGEMELPGAQGARMTDAVSKIWIDKKLSLDLQSNISMKVQMAQLPEPMEVHMQMVKKDLKIDQPVAESLFQFTPPADAKEVETLMGATLTKADLTGKTAPAFEVKGLDGKAYSLESLKGKPVLLDFWATWCGPCRKSMPLLEKLHAAYKDQGLVVLAVDTGEDRNTVAEFLKTSPMPYPAALSGESGILEAYQVSAFPTFVMIGRDGKVVAHEIGFSGEATFNGIAQKAGLTPPK